MEEDIKTGKLIIDYDGSKFHWHFEGDIPPNLLNNALDIIKFQLVSAQLTLAMQNRATQESRKVVLPDGSMIPPKFS